MNKVWIILVLAVVLAAQYTFLTSVKSVHTTVFDASGTSAVIVSKAPYMSVRAEIQINPIYSKNENVTLVFSDGSQKQVTRSYHFEVFLPRTDKNMGLGARIIPQEASSGLRVTPEEGAYLSNDHPISAVVVVNVTDYFFNFYGIGTQNSSTFDVYWFKVQGQAQIIVSGAGVAV
jgi:hypothetical protein